MNAYWVGSVDLDIMIGEDDVVSSISTSWSMDAVNSRTAEDATVSKIVKTHRTESEASALISNFGESLASTIHLDDIIATVRDGHNSDVVTAHSSTLPLDTRMSSVRRHEATGGNLIADAMFWMLQTNIHVPIGIAHNNSSNDNAASSLPMLAMINGGFIRGDTLYQPGSAISVRDVLKELPFPHCMQVLEMSGVYLKEAILQQLKGSSNGPTGAYPHLWWW
jgi:2',3'-cyclic-nucleotide 2'-phosphodiesterase (5'-nucleotidase family)